MFLLSCSKVIMEVEMAEWTPMEIEAACFYVIKLAPSELKERLPMM